VGFVSFEGGLTMDIIESWAIHAGAFPASMIAGSEGGLSLGYQNDVKFYHEVAGFPAESVLDVGNEMYRMRKIDPKQNLYSGSQEHWIGALKGECELLNTAETALQTMLVSEGIYMSGKLKREVTADEIKSMSASPGIRRQETSFGILEYDW
jgi:hypothetical protein